MSKPSFSNIDLWLFEYAEGNLTDDQVAQLELFILQHPELDVDRDMWEMAHVSKEAPVFTDQNSLIKRKPVGAYWAIGAGTLTMVTLIFGAYLLFDTSGTVASQQQLAETVDYSEEYAHSLFSETATERELRQEVSDLKALVTSLENQLQQSEGVVASNLSNNTIDLTVDNAGNNADVTGVDNGNYRELRAMGWSESSLILANAGNGNSTYNQNATDVEAMPNVTNTANAVSSLTDAQTVAHMDRMTSVRPTSLQSLAFHIQPVSRYIGTESSELNNGSDDLASSGDGHGRKVNYESSYKHKLSKFIRQVRNMANNPIALKNHRDAYHHVPGMTSTDLNFGATGTMIAPRFQAMSRLQGDGQQNELFTNQIGFDGYVFGARGGVGVQMTHNYYNNGGIQTGEVAVTYSPKLSVNRKFSIEPAVRLKMGSKLLDANRMEGTDRVEFIPGNTIDYYQDGTTPVGRMLWYRDMGLGLNVNTEWFYASAQVDNIFRHGDNIYSNDLEGKRRAGTYFVATLGTDWESDDSEWETQRAKFSLSPYLVYRNFENVNELWAGANFRAYWLTVGASVSSNGDPAASLGVISSDKRFSLMYNADYSQSHVTNERSLSHQLTLRIAGKQSRIGRRN